MLVASSEHEKGKFAQILAKKGADVTPSAPALMQDVAIGSIEDFYRAMPPKAEGKTAMTRFYQAAEKQQITLYQGEYRLLPQKYTKVSAYEIALPVRASYVQLRRFINQALTDIPSLALVDVDFKRQKIDDPMLDAQLKFTLYLRDQ